MEARPYQNAESVDLAKVPLPGLKNARRAHQDCTHQTTHLRQVED